MPHRFPNEEVVLGDVPEINVPEIQVSYHRNYGKPFLGTFSYRKDAANFIRSTFNVDTLELQEQFIVLYLDPSWQIIGYYRHTIGTIKSVQLDFRLILGVGLKCACTSVVIAHNHPSGNARPSDADIKTTKEFIKAAKACLIDTVDHFIITKDSYYSFQENGFSGLKGLKPDKKEEKRSEFVAHLENDLVTGVKSNKRSLEKLGLAFGIQEKTTVKELTELAIVNVARRLAHAPGTAKERFDLIVRLYHSQVNLSHRTSQSILLQQYSTPAPIGYLAGHFCRIDDPLTNDVFFEPSAGNGLLTIAGDPQRFVVNEIDGPRNSNLKTQGFKEVWELDASIPFSQIHHKFNAVLTNPPFGKMDVAVSFDGFPIKTLEHVMALRALDCLNNKSRAAIIIGGHMKWDEQGRIQAGNNRIFFNYLYSCYHVIDVINIDGKKLYSRQGTAVNVRLILIAGRKTQPEGNAPLYSPARDSVIDNFASLFKRVSDARSDVITLEAQKTLDEARKLLKDLKLDNLGELDAPYRPASEKGTILNTQVPDSMAFETQTALQQIKEAVGGDMDNFVRHRLGFPTRDALAQVLSAEQIDAIGMAIFNVEAKNQGMIIGDQTGIGKGRVAAAMIRYGVLQGVKPVFLTEKANLFSDIYRDLAAIGSGHLRPFIVNSRESKTDIKDEDGEIVYQAPSPVEQKDIFDSREVPGRYDFVVGTYSQFNSAEKKPVKPNFLLSIAKDNVFILDEAHNASGSSNTGEFLQGVVAQTKGVVFLSATFAKRPDNMPIYAMKTAISDCNMSREELVQAIKQGGVALQEVLSAQLVAEGQMIRRERSFEGVEVNYIALDDKAQEHRAIVDNITEVLRDIIAFQRHYINPKVDALDKIAAAQSKEVDLRSGTQQAGVDNQPYFSKVFQVINQMLFSLKAEAVAEKAIQRLQEGKKPVIAFASTMGSFIETMDNERGEPVGDGDIINADFSEVLKRGLTGVMRYTVKEGNGQSSHREFEISDFSPEAQREYFRIEQQINAITTGITISPIDVIIRRIENAGYSLAEVTGRKYSLQINDTGTVALVQSRKRVNTNDAFRRFNNNEVDVLMINQSGSTGASAHAVPTAKVSKDKVRQRVMIVLQAEMDISTEVQKRGRINRTGQLLQPIYDYIMSAVPAEKRLMMMLQKKLKSLDANTTSNQKQSSKILDVPDFLNKYGDRVARDYLYENPEIDVLLDHPLFSTWSTNSDDQEAFNYVEAASKVSGRVAILSTQMQEDFYNDMSQRYDDHVEYLKQIGDYDLEVEAMNLETETLSARVIKMGKGGQSAFGNDSTLETVRANVLKKPFTVTELENLLIESNKNDDPAQEQQYLREGYAQSVEARLKEEREETRIKFDQLIKNVPEEKKIKAVLQKNGETAWSEAVKIRRQTLEAAYQAELQNLEKATNNRKMYLERIFKFYYPGRLLNYPVENYQSGSELVPAVFLGFMIDLKKKNPYAPSAIKLRYAIASSAKYIAIPASYSESINAIIGVSADLDQPEMPDLLSQWKSYIEENNVDRRIRHIITGNLLQAFSDGKGKLVSYTTLDGQTKKGILLPENWERKSDAENTVTVPVLKALPIIQSLVVGQNITTNNGVAFIRNKDFYKIVVSATLVKGGDIYLDRQLLPLVDKQIFEKVSDKMVAKLPEANIAAFVRVLQNNHSSSIAIPPSEAEHLKPVPIIPNHYKPIELPPPEEVPAPKTAMLRMLELKAKALQVKLQLLNAA